MADALNVEPAVAIAAAAKPIAILRIMILLHLLGDAPHQPRRLPLSCSVRQYRSVSRRRNPNLSAAGVAAFVSTRLFLLRGRRQRVQTIEHWPPGRAVAER